MPTLFKVFGFSFFIDTRISFLINHFFPRRVSRLRTLTCLYFFHFFPRRVSRLGDSDELLLHSFTNACSRNSAASLVLYFPPASAIANSCFCQSARGGRLRGEEESKRHPTTVAATASLQGPVSPRVFSQRSQ